jgi:curved DNA-binding protein CbpA
MPRRSGGINLVKILNSVLLTFVFLSSVVLGAGPKRALEANNLFQVLGLDQSASQEKIGKAYRSWSLKWYPDLDKEGIHAGRFKELTAANEILGDESSRMAYLEYMTLVRTSGVERISALRQTEILYKAKEFSLGGQITGRDFLQAHRFFLRQNENYTFDSDVEKAQEQAKAHSEKLEAEKRAAEVRDRMKNEEEARRIEAAKQARADEERLRVEAEQASKRKNRSRRCAYAFASVSAIGAATLLGSAVYRLQNHVIEQKVGTEAAAETEGLRVNLVQEEEPKPSGSKSQTAPNPPGSTNQKAAHDSPPTQSSPPAIPSPSAAAEEVARKRGSKLRERLNSK